jgi:hypothetical protein
MAEEMESSGTADKIRAEKGNMQTIAQLREKYDLHMNVEIFVSADTPESENKFIRK